MQQVKIFHGIESSIQAIESKVNGWLRENHCKVINIFGNMSPQTGVGQKPTDSYISSNPYAPSDVFLVIVYEAKSD